MCGKFSYMATWAEVHDFSQPLVQRPTNAPEETTTPMQWAPVLVREADGERTMIQMRWGFTALRAGREFPEYIHARDDKVLTSTLWRPHVESRRGILVVSSFNEGEEVPTFKPDRVTPTGKTRTRQWTVRPRDGSRLAIAVIYRLVTTPGGARHEFVMCTTTANKGLSEFVAADPDQRMPAVLHEEDIPVWLGETPATPEDIRSVLRTYEDEGRWHMAPAGSAPAPGKPRGSFQDDLF